MKIFNSRLSVAMLWLFVLGLVLSHSMPVQAQQTSNPPPSQDQINSQLLVRIQELEEQVKQLRALSGSTTGTGSASLTAAPPLAVPAPAPPVEAAAVAEVNEVAPRLKLEIFGDAAAKYVRGNSNTFLFGSLDLFTTARLSSRITTLGELLFIAENDNTVSVDVERLLFKYQQSPYLGVTVGRYHTWVGYYNTRYNKAELLETTTDRPFMYDFDDQGGVLPMQDVGINVSGKIPSGKLGLNYVVELGNGRDWVLNSEPVQNNQDVNNSKSINGGLFVRPRRFSGMQAGFSLRHDNLTIPGPAIGETIATAHGVYNNGTWEILNEALMVLHDEAGGIDYNTNAFYSQFSRAFGSVRPYFRYQYFNAPSTDPVWNLAEPTNFAPATTVGFVGRVNGPSIGMRYNLNENAAIKFQYDYMQLRDLPDANALTLQIAFSF